MWSFDAAQVYASPVKSRPCPVIAQKTEPPVSTSQKRLVLVTGNGNYQASVLANPENDARDMKTALEQFGFDVMKYENLNQSQMKQVMDDFGGRLQLPCSC